MDYKVTGDSTLKKEFNQFWNQSILLNNAVTLFILVQNVDIVTFNLDTAVQQSFSFSRGELESLYGRDLRQYAKDKMLWQQEVLYNLTNSSDKLNKLTVQGAD